MVQFYFRLDHIELYFLSKYAYFYDNFETKYTANHSTDGYPNLENS